MNHLLRILILSVLVFIRSIQAFVPSANSLRTVHARPFSATLAAAAASSATAGRSRRWTGGSARGPGFRNNLNMLFGRSRKAPQLSEEELADMARAREEANKKIEEFLEQRREEKAARKDAQMEEQREKVAQRIKAEKEEAEHKKAFIPRRLEEIEREEAMLQERVSAFNTKIKDKEIEEL